MDEEQLKHFLEVIKMIESSGGKNTDHKEMDSGIQAGTAAMGSYGLMPNTVKEMSKRMKSPSPEATQFAQLPPEQMGQSLTPDVENAYAQALAQRVLNRQSGDEEKAAYSWMYGHNLKPHQVEERGYQTDPYVEKYNMYKAQMFPKVRQLIGKK